MQQRRSKIIASLGPSTDAPGVLDGMISAGLNGARINCSHGNRSDWERRVTQARAAAQRAGVHIAVLVDIQGPKIRLSADTPRREVAPDDEMVFTVPANA